MDLENGVDATFLEVDPRDGFSVRNFHIQATKMAMVSDIVVYGDDNAKKDDLDNLAKRVAVAQRTWRVKNNSSEENAPIFNTFIMSSKSS